MIVFINNKNYIPYIQGMFKSDILVYNFSSGYPDYGNIYPLINLAGVNPTTIPINIYVDMPEFEMQYLYCVLNNYEKFGSLMNIMMPSYYGYIVCILIYHDQYRDSILESLIRLIQKRYEYNPYIVDDIEDIEYLKENGYGTNGLLTLQSDMKVYNELYHAGNIPLPYALPDVNIE